MIRVFPNQRSSDAENLRIVTVSVTPTAHDPLRVLFTNLKVAPGFPQVVKMNLLVEWANHRRH